MAAMQPHRRGLPEKDRLSEKAISVLGRLNLFGRISDEMLEAGRKYAATVNAYRAVIGAVDPLMQPIPGFGRVISDEEAKRRTVAYNDSIEAIGYMVFGSLKPAKAVSKAAVYDDPAYGSFQDLHLGLSTLAKFYGLTGRNR